MRQHPKQLKLPLPASHGGRRPGAGRPNRSGLQAHVRRQRLNPREPIHVTLKLAPGLPSFRKKETFRCLRLAVGKARMRGLHVVHFAILSNHVHLIIEARGASVGRVFQSLGISFAKRVNAILNRRGPVFLERYHLRILKTPSEVRRALAYVLTNEFQHRSRRGAGASAARGCEDRPEGGPEITIDMFSSAYVFRGWRQLLGRNVRFRWLLWSETKIETWLEEIVAPPRTWLLGPGWRRGLA